MDQDLKLVMYPIPTTIGEIGPGSVLFVLGILFVSKFAIIICGSLMICLDIYMNTFTFYLYITARSKWLSPEIIA